MQQSRPPTRNIADRTAAGARGIIPAGTGLTVYRDFKVKTDETIATEPEEYVDLTALVNKTNAL